MTDVLLKIGEVAKQLGVGKHAARRMVPQVVLGPKTIRYRQSDVAAIIAGDFSKKLASNRLERQDLNGNKMNDWLHGNQQLRHKRTYPET